MLGEGYSLKWFTFVKRQGCVTPPWYLKIEINRLMKELDERVITKSNSKNKRNGLFIGSEGTVVHG